MGYRMFRSIITVAILGLAVAFLVHMLAYGLISQSTREAAYEELREDRESGELITRLSSPDSPAMVLEAMANPPRPGRLNEYARWAGVDEATFEAAVEAAEEVDEFDVYLSKLPPASLAALAGELETAPLLATLSDEQAYIRFRESVEALSLSPPLGDWPNFASFLENRFTSARQLSRAISQGHAQAITQIREAYPDRTPQGLFINPPEQLGQVLREAGFAYEDERIEAVTAYVNRTADYSEINRLIGSVEPVRQALARRLDVQKGELDQDRVLEFASSRKNAAWLSELFIENGGKESLSSERIASLSDFRLRQIKLERAVGEGVEAGGPFMGLPMSTLYLIALSFLVCVVGVANAMLMSVTERFTEIATMKCLGAMDRFVMMMFVFEAAIQGIIGGLGGLVLGILLAILRGLIDFGTLIAAASDALGEIAIASVLSLLVGMLLATFAAVGPSWVAARLAPMEAMRVE